MVLSPTRELAQQTEAVAKKFGSSCGLFTVSVYGGASRQVQINLLRNKCDIVVGTPGRMIDLLECGGKFLTASTYSQWLRQEFMIMGSKLVCSRDP